MSKEEKVIDPASELGIFGNSEDGRVLSSGAGTSIQGGAKAGSGAGDGRRFDKRSDDSSLADSGRREERVISRGDRRDDRPEKKGDASKLPVGWINHVILWYFHGTILFITSLVCPLLE